MEKTLKPAIVAVALAFSGAVLAQGTPIREAAARVGVAPSTLTRAKRGSGLPAGRPGRKKAPDAA